VTNVKVMMKPEALFSNSYPGPILSESVGTFSRTLWMEHDNVSTPAFYTFETVRLICIHLVHVSVLMSGPRAT
jgi:hypothetical protein